MTVAAADGGDAAAAAVVGIDDRIAAVVGESLEEQVGVNAFDLESRQEDALLI